MGSDIAAWLARFGLEEYAQLLEDNKIDLEVLPDLTEEDLAELDVPMGHRKRFLRAIAAIGAASSSDAPVLETSDGRGPDPVAKNRPGAERKQITVLFCDLVGSSALSEELDPEDLQRVIAMFRDACGEAVKRYDGFVAQYLGDGILAYFGYPQAHENDAERAVHASLDLVEAVKAIGPNGLLTHGIEVRVGISTGLVLVGNPGGRASEERDGIFGETPNIAARLQTHAPPNGIVISASTRDLVGDLFSFEALGPLKLKGIKTSVQAWRVIEETSLKSRSEALHQRSDLTPLVGRDEEVDILKRRWKRADGGDGQVVLILGEPGIGKSRLVGTLRDQIAGPSLTLRYYCSPIYQHTALQPITLQISRDARMSPKYSSRRNFRKLRAYLKTANIKSAKTVRLFADLMSIPLDPDDAARYPALELSPQGQKQRTIRVLEQLVSETARTRSVLIVFEDLHWCDPTTLEVLDRVVGRIPHMRSLLLATFRPEFLQSWSGEHHVTSLVMKRMTPKESDIIVKGMDRAQVLPPHVVSKIVEETDGIPLFIEELCKTVLSSKSISENQSSYVASDLSSEITVPTSLVDSLMERLDRLGEVKTVAQMAAALGREFSYDLIAAISPLTDDALGEALKVLDQTGIITESREGPAVRYRFGHALLQDAALSSLLRSERQELHGRIAVLLEQDYPETVEREPEVVAQHFTDGGLIDKAVDYWRRAGQRAIERSANVEAIDHFTRGLELLSQTPSTSDRDERELAIQMRLGPALTATRGFAAPEVEVTYARAQKLCEKLDDAVNVFFAVRGLWVHAFISARLTSAHKFARDLFELPLPNRNSGHDIEAHRTLAQTLLYMGNLTESLSHSEQGIALYDPEQHGSHVFLYGNDPLAVCTAYRAFTLWFLGFPDQAIQQSKTATAVAQQKGHPFTRAFSAAFAAYLSQHLRDPLRTEELATKTIEIATDQGFPFWINQETILQGWSLVERGQIEEGLSQMHKGLAKYRAMGSKLAHPWFLCMLAEAYARADKAELALNTLEEALVISQNTGEWLHLAEIHRLQGDIALQHDGLEAAGRAQNAFQKSYDIALRQGAKSWCLRTAISWARLLRDLGQPDAAYERLRPVYDEFTEGFETFDLRAADRLLGELETVQQAV